MTTPGTTPMIAPMSAPTSTLARLREAAVAYHLLVALIFTACLPLTLARSLGTRADAADGGALAGALDTARAAAASAFSLPG